MSMACYHHGACGELTHGTDREGHSSGHSSVSDRSSTVRIISPDYESGSNQDLALWDGSESEGALTAPGRSRSRSPASVRRTTSEYYVGKRICGVCGGHNGSEWLERRRCQDSPADLFMIVRRLAQKIHADDEIWFHKECMDAHAWAHGVRSAFVTTTPMTAVVCTECELPILRDRTQPRRCEVRGCEARLHADGWHHGCTGC